MPHDYARTDGNTGVTFVYCDSSRLRGVKRNKQSSMGKIVGIILAEDNRISIPNRADKFGRMPSHFMRSESGVTSCTQSSVAAALLITAAMWM